MMTGNICGFCSLVFDEDDETCADHTEAKDCTWAKPTPMPLKIVGQEDDPEGAARRLDAMRELIRNGAAWIQEPWLALMAEDYIKRGLCKPPRSKIALTRRKLWLASR